ncbi:MAG: DUF6659 family protein [Nitrosopumilaceae archaeon]
MSHEKICQRVMKLDPKMRSVRIINDRGHQVAGGMKKGLKSLEDTKQDEMMFMEIALRVRMRHEFDKEFGKTLFSLSYRDKVIILSFPMSDGNVLLVSGEKDLDFGKIPFKIIKILESFPSGSKTF